MRDRLIELLCNVKCEGEECFGNCPHRIGQKCNKVQRLEMCSVFAIADHLLAAGVIVPPCKVGDMVYWFDNGAIKDGTVFEISIHSDGILLHTGTRFSLEVEEVFLTREDAEQALKGEQDEETYE